MIPERYVGTYLLATLPFGAVGIVLAALAPGLRDGDTVQREMAYKLLTSVQSYNATLSSDPDKRVRLDGITREGADLLFSFVEQQPSALEAAKVRSAIRKRACPSRGGLGLWRLDKRSIVFAYERNDGSRLSVEVDQRFCR